MKRRQTSFVHPFMHTYTGRLHVGATSDTALQQTLNNEQSKHNDLVQFHFVDSYRNLTYKAISTLAWIQQCCSHAKLVLKVDDDVFVNIPAFLQRMRDGQLDSGRRLICMRWPYRSVPILRDPANCMKWCVDENDFPGGSILSAKHRVFLYRIYLSSHIYR